MFKAVKDNELARGGVLVRSKCRNARDSEPSEHHMAVAAVVVDMAAVVGNRVCHHGN